MVPEVAWPLMVAKLAMGASPITKTLMPIRPGANGLKAILTMQSEPPQLQQREKLLDSFL